jgi:hypothetical protein
MFSLRYAMQACLEILTSALSALIELLFLDMLLQHTTLKRPSSDGCVFLYTNDRGVRRWFADIGNVYQRWPVMYSTWRWLLDKIPSVGGSCLIWRAVLGGDIQVARKQWVARQSWCWSNKKKVLLPVICNASVTCVRNMRPWTVVLLWRAFFNESIIRTFSLTAYLLWAYH